MMGRTGKPLFGGAMVCCVLVVGMIVFIDSFTRPPSRAERRELTENVRAFFGGLRVAGDSCRLARELSQIDPATRAATIEVLRERAKHQKDVSAEMRGSLTVSLPSLQALAGLPRLLGQGEELLDLALVGSPTRPVSASQATTAPVLSGQADVTGVLPGLTALVKARADQLGRDAVSLTQEVDSQAFGSVAYSGTFCGQSVRRWLFLPCVPALLALLAIAVGLRSLRTAPERMLEHKIRQSGQADPRKGIRLCHDQVTKLLDLADKMMQQLGS
jgi:hypothetical protein